MVVFAEGFLIEWEKIMNNKKRDDLRRHCQFCSRAVSIVSTLLSDISSGLRFHPRFMGK